MRYNLSHFRYEDGSVYRVWLGFIPIWLFNVEGREAGISWVNHLAGVDESKYETEAD